MSAHASAALPGTARPPTIIPARSSARSAVAPRTRALTSACHPAHIPPHDVRSPPQREERPADEHRAEWDVVPAAARPGGEEHDADHAAHKDPEHDRERPERPPEKRADHRGQL